MNNIEKILMGVSMLTLGYLSAHKNNMSNTRGTPVILWPDVKEDEGDNPGDNIPTITGPPSDDSSSTNNSTSNNTGNNTIHGIPTIHWPPFGWPPFGPPPAPPTPPTPPTHLPSIQIPVAQPENTVPGYSTYVSLKYEVEFDYPSDWTQNPRYEDKYEGPSGFFEIGDFTGANATIQEAVAEQIDTPYEPYGSNPNVQYTTIDGQPAAIIWPSDDQNTFYSDRDCVIIVRYPTPNDINGSLYNFVDVWTTPDYIPVIKDTFKFVNIKRDA